jgi:hypothetical protein
VATKKEEKPDPRWFDPIRDAYLMKDYIPWSGDSPEKKAMEKQIKQTGE